MKTSCNDEETLADFLEGRLKEEQLNTTAEHLADCNRCLDTVIIGSGLLRAGSLDDMAAVPDAVTRETVAIVNRLNTAPKITAPEKVSNSIKMISSKVSRWFSHEFWGNRQLAPVRGEMTIVSDNLIQVKKKFRSFQTNIEIEKIDNATAIIRVTLISGEQKHSRTRVTLKKGAREVSSELISEKLVVFESIPFGKYSLVFSRLGETIGNYKFEIKETVNEP